MADRQKIIKYSFVMARKATDITIRTPTQLEQCGLLPTPSLCDLRSPSLVNHNIQRPLAPASTACGNGRTNHVKFRGVASTVVTSCTSIH